MRVPISLLVLTLTAVLAQGCRGDVGQVEPVASDVLVSVVPPAATTSRGGEVHFQASSSGDGSIQAAGFSWSVEEPNGGAVDSSGRYTAPQSSGIFHVVAASKADPTKQARASVTVQSSVMVSVSPRSASVVVGASTSFTATVTGTDPGDSTAVTWSVQEQGGGTIDGSGTYVAPGATGTFHVIATSAADPSRTDAATVVVGAAQVIAVDIVPSNASTTTGGSLAFSATVTGTTAGQSTAVTWSVQEGGGGTIDSSGHYLAPGTTGTFHVLATSVADPSKTATATISVTATPVVAVSVSPGTATIRAGGTAAFTATVTGTTGGQSTSVTWSVQESGGGTVDGAGRYTAPGTPGTFHVVATSVADTSKQAIATVTVIPPIAVSIAPPTASTTTGGTAAFTATVTGTTAGQSTAVTWSVQESGGGTVDGSGHYTAPASAGTYHVVATSVADTSKQAKATVTVAPPPGISVTISPSSATVAPSSTATFTATVTGTTGAQSTAVTWSVQEGAGGGAVDASGRYTAPATAGTYHVVATSVADTSKKATATISVATVSIIAANRRTTWSPGILADQPLGLALGTDGLPQRTTVCATVNPGGDIQAAINGCPANQVVQLGAGTFTITSTIQLKSNVVLRGAGSGAGGTTIVKSNGGTVMAIGTQRDRICAAGNGQGVALTADGVKETNTLTIGSAASSFAVGDLILVDQIDVSPVVLGDCSYNNLKRNNGDGWRSLSQVDEVVAVNAGSGTLTLGSPLHWTFQAGGSTKAEVVRVTSATVRWAGIEHLHLQGGTRGSYLGQSAGGIDISNAAYCWVKDVQTDATNDGMHVRLGGTYRCVVRDAYFHHSATYGFGEDCYGIVLGCGVAETLVENNIVRYMNKPIMFQISGGGNVVGYNYADNSWADGTWQEVNIDSHCSFSHMELMEGNLAPHMGATSTHGNAGYFTFFRNYSSTHFADPSVADTNLARTGNITALDLEAGAVGMNVVGNVLGAAGITRQYDYFSNGAPGAIYELGNGGGGQNDIAATSLFRTGNYDYFHNSTQWDGGSVVTIPSSLYLSGAPAWWPGGMAWPWVGPDLSPMVKTLPAKVRSDSM